MMKWIVAQCDSQGDTISLRSFDGSKEKARSILLRQIKDARNAKTECGLEVSGAKRLSDITDSSIRLDANLEYTEVLDERVDFTAQKQSKLKKVDLGSNTITKWILAECDSDGGGIKLCILLGSREAVSKHINGLISAEKAYRDESYQSVVERIMKNGCNTSQAEAEKEADEELGFIVYDTSRNSEISIALTDADMSQRFYTANKLADLLEAM